MNGVGIDEMLRRLHDPDRGVAKQRHCAFQELRRRDEVRVEDGNEVGRIGQCGDMLERVVYVSGFGVRIVGSREVTATEFGAKRLHPIPAAVIEHPDAETRIVHAKRADDRSLQNLFLFVVGADEHID